MNSASAPGATQPSSELESGNQATSKGRVLAWASWDWGSAAFNAVMTTFVFTVYLTSNAFGGEDQASAVLGGALAVAGFAQWFSNYLIAQSFPRMAASLGLAVSYSFYAVCAVISFFLVQRFIQETKGKELEAMEG